LPNSTLDDTKYPDSEFAIYEDGIFFNHKTKQTYYYHLGDDRFNELEITDKNENLEPLSISELKCNITQQAFENMVLTAKDYIVEGDIFQTVLSQRTQTTFKGDLQLFYDVLRRINPSPYMYHLKMDERRIIGSSPEMLIRVEGDRVETFPIAGTRPRKSNLRQNKELENELLADSKDRAEHVMLVDLARNDLGKISNYGTVKTTEFMQVHQYSHVQHIVSHVIGKLKKENDAFDTLRAVFPAGTVSGAPKVRAMEIIDELEHTRRGPYAGAVGYFSYNGNSDFAIIIRTLTSIGNRAYVQAGAGIVADSQPTKEWLETKDKAAGPIKALRIAVEGEI
jgi:anthranilate synthase component 1